MVQPVQAGWWHCQKNRAGVSKMRNKRQTFIGSLPWDFQGIAFVYGLWGSSLIGESQIGTSFPQVPAKAWQMLPFPNKLTHHQAAIL
jgi:hypothetical protein